MEAEYVSLMLTTKEIMWLQLLPTKLGLLLSSNQYAKIKITEGSRGARKIKANFWDQEKENNEIMALNATSINSSTSRTVISLKGNNQKSIALVHNPFYHAQKKQIDIQHYYICNKIAATRINF